MANTITIVEDAAGAWKTNLNTLFNQHSYVLLFAINTATNPDAGTIYTNVCDMLNSFPTLYAINVPTMSANIAGFLESILKAAGNDYKNDFADCLAFSVSIKSNSIADFILPTEPNATDALRALACFTKADTYDPK